MLPASADGLKSWILSTGKSFSHHSVIEAILGEGDEVMIKIRIQLKHIGIWRGIEPLGAEVSAVGYRYFKLKDKRIIGHLALIDGNAIENQLKETSVGCKIQQ